MMSFQFCKTPWICKHNVLFYLVDLWILLGVCQRKSCPWYPSTILVGWIVSIISQYLFKLKLFWTLCSWQCSYCRLCIVFLAFDVFFIVFCVAVACLVGIAICCCLPCIIAILYAVADQVLLALDNFCFAAISRGLLC